MAAVILSQVIPGSAASGPTQLGVYGNANAVSNQHILLILTMLLLVCISFCMSTKVHNCLARRREGGIPLFLVPLRSLGWSARVDGTRTCPIGGRKRCMFLSRLLVYCCVATIIASTTSEIVATVLANCCYIFYGQAPTLVGNSRSSDFYGQEAISCAQVQAAFQTMWYKYEYIFARFLILLCYAVTYGIADPATRWAGAYRNPAGDIVPLHGNRNYDRSNKGNPPCQTPILTHTNDTNIKQQRQNAQNPKQITLFEDFSTNKNASYSGSLPLFCHPRQDNLF